MSMQKKLVSAALALVMGLSLGGCAGKTSSAAAASGKSGTGTSSAASTAAAGSGAWKPTQNITFVVPFEAGGNSDIPARIFAKYMSKYAGVTVSVTNIEGAGGRTGAQQVKGMKADGYTVLMQPVGYPMQSALGLANFTYKDFDMVGQWLDSSLALVVNSKSGITSLDDLVAKAKSAPGTVKVGSVSGTLPLFAAMYLQQQAGVQFNLVDIDASNKAPELMSNRIDAYIDGFGSVKQYVDSGDFTCLAVYSDKDVPGYETLNTLAELKYTGYEYLKQSFGMWAPKGTPAAAVEFLNGLIKQASADPDCIAELNKAGFSPAYMTVKDYTSFMETSYATFKKAAESIAK